MKTYKLLSQLLIAVWCMTGSIACQSRQTDVDQFRNYYVAFTEPGQESRGDVSADKNATVRGTVGSAFQTSRDGIKLLAGHILIQSADRQFALGVASTLVKVHPHTRLSICHTDDGIVATNMNGTFDLISDCSHITISEPGTIAVSQDNQGNIHSNPIQAEAFKSDEVAGRSSKPIIIIAKLGSMFTPMLKQVYISSGTCLLSAPKDTLIATPGGTVTSGSSYIAAVRMHNGVLGVENCTVPSTIFFHVLGTEVKLGPGRSCVLQHAPLTSRLAPIDGVARRQATGRTNGSLSAIVADFELTSLVKSDATIYEAVKHPITEEETKLSNQLTKNIAVLGLSLGNRGVYYAEAPITKVYGLGAFKDSLATANVAGVR